MKLLHLYVFCMLLIPDIATADPWSWLDKPEKQEWSQVEINGYDRRIVFAIPDRAKSGARVIRVPKLEQNQKNQIIDVALSSLNKESNLIIGFDWERRWGGFFKRDVTDYSLRVYVTLTDESYKLLDKSVHQRMEAVREYFMARFSTPVTIGNRDFFFEKFKIEPYHSSQPYVWTKENAPTVVKEHEDFRLPISDNRELIFSFYYRMEVKGPKKSQEWLERRKALSRKILDTVRIIPDPYTE